MADNQTAVMETELQPVSQTLQAGEKDADSQVWHRIDTFRDSNGNTVIRTNVAYVELQTGMFYREDGEWKVSREVIESCPGGAIARQGGHKVIFAEDFRSETVVDMETTDGKRLQSRVLGLSYVDSASGKSVLLAEATNSIGQIINSNQVLYADAFSGAIKASIRFTYTKAGLEQDVILVERPPTAESFGLVSETTTLRVMTEFLSPPQPIVTIIKSGEKDGEDEDQLLDFGTMQMGQGKAFAVGLEEANPDEVPIKKQWTVIAGRTILIEQVALARIADQLEALPAKKRTAFFWNKQKKAVQQTASLKLKLPARKPAKPVQRQMQLAKLSAPLRGVVLDYSLLASAPDVTLKADTTYYVSGLVNLSGTTTNEGGTVVKFDNSSSAKISVGGNGLVCQTGPYRPAVFTSKFDSSVGETVATGTPVNTGATYLEVTAGTNALKYLRFLYAGTALAQSYVPRSIWHSQFLLCTNAIKDNPLASSVTQELHNVLLAQCAVGVNGVSGTVSVQGEHVTADQITQFWIGPGTPANALTNSVLTAIGNMGATTTYNHTEPPLAGTGVYHAPVGAGNYYLADGSIYRSAGTPTINPALLVDLKQKTTYPPVVRSAHFTSDTILNPSSSLVLRDNSCSPDRGYHYDALDYCWTGLNLNNATLTLADGVAVGFYGQYGTILQTGSRIISQGAPQRHIQLARYSSVQEQPSSAWATSFASMALLQGSCVLAQFNFTDVSFLAATYSKRYFLWQTSSAGANQWFMKDCQLRAAYLVLADRAYGNPTIGFTNNIFERCKVELSRYYYDFSLSLVNNLFAGGSFNAAGASTGYYYYWTLANNLFDRVTLTWSVNPPTHTQNNAYYQTTALPPIPGPSYTLSTVDYQAGPLGGYYYPNQLLTSGDLFTLIDAGNGTPASLGLNTYTVRADQLPDNTDPVDVGFHYFPCSMPTASPPSVQTCRNSPVSIALDGTDPNGFSVYFYVVAGPSHGVLTSCGQYRTYTPTAGYVGPDSFTYIVSDGYLSSAPATVSITIASAPDITVQPVSVTVCAGGTATFMVTVSGSGLTYRWRKNGVRLNDDSHVSGASTSQLTINSVAFPDVGSYDVVVSACVGCCTTISSPATLTLGNATIIGQTLQPTVTPGAVGKFSVTVSGGGPSLAYQWQESINGGAFQNVAGATSRVYTSPQGSLGTVALYHVVVTGSCGPPMTSHDAPLNVLPSIPEGTAKWSHSMQPQVSPEIETYVDSSPAIATDGTIYAQSTHRNSASQYNRDDRTRLRSLNPDGTENWFFEMGPAQFEITASPAIAPDGTVYASCFNRLFAVNPNGTQKWVCDFGTAVSGEGGAFSPAIAADGTIYITLDDSDANDTGVLFAIDPNDGHVKWMLPVGPGIDIESSPAVASDGTVYFLDEGIQQLPQLHAASPDGQPKWSIAVPILPLPSAPSIEPGSSPAVDIDGTVYVGNVAVTPPATVGGQPILKWPTIASPSPIATVWASSPSIGPVQNPVAPNGVVYVVDGETPCNLFALDRIDGHELWHFTAQNPGGEATYSSPAVGANGTVYFGASDSKLYAVVPPATGNTALWTLTTLGPILSSPAIDGANNTVYAGSQDGNVYAVVEHNTLGPTAWPMFRKNLKHTASY